MFKNEFQGGQYLDVFSVQGKDPLSKLKIAGPSPAIQKEFDNELRTFILHLQGDPARSKISFPKNSKQTLHLTQQFLVFQLFLQSGQSFSLEVAIVTQSNLKLRVILSSSNREISITAHHVKMPCSVVECNTWVNLCLDLRELVTSFFDGNTFGHVDSLVVSANCKLKRIFTLKSKPTHSIDIPKTFDLQSNIHSSIQVIDYDTFISANINIRSATGNPDQRTPHKVSGNENTHIAFGRRVRSDSHSSSKITDIPVGSQQQYSERSNSSNQRQSSRSGKSSTRANSGNDGRSQDSFETSLTSRGMSILPSKPHNKTLNGRDSDSHIDNSNLDENNNKTSNSYQPRPPPDKSSKKNVRRPRVVKSADLRVRGTAQASEQKPKQQQFSKSADSRNRRRPLNSDFELDDASSRQSTLPTIMKLKKGISRSAVDLEVVEREIRDNRDLHFKSKSMTVLPKISNKNNRYSKNTSEQHRDGGSIEVEEKALDGDNNTALHDNVFTADDDETSEELMALADENEVDDYLKQRTRSNCGESTSLSSCNSANSDLYMYSSRPRSVIRQQKESLTAHQMSRSRGGSVNDTTSSNTKDEVTNSSETHFSRDFNNNNDDIEPIRNDASAKVSDRDKTELISSSATEKHDETFAMPTFTHAANDDKTFLTATQEDDLGVDLSWEYSESTSMLVIPEDFKQEASGDQINHLSEERTELDVSLTHDNDARNADDYQQLPISDKEVVADEKQSVDQITSENSSGVVSDASSMSDLNNNTIIINNQVETIDGHQPNSLIPSSFVMRDSCDSDTMSWLHNSQDQGNMSVAMTTTLDKMKSPNMALRQRLKEQLGSLIAQSRDVESESDGFSECSDDTTYTDLPPKRFRNYRYQDEIQSISSTLDLSATIPATPRVGEQAGYGNDMNNNGMGENMDGTESEELLDLMFDPELNCYYDPVTHKYYELN